MKEITVAIPAASDGGLSAGRSDHFGHCPFFVLVDIRDDGRAADVRVLANIAHGKGGCMKPVAMLAENGVSALVSGGMGNGPFQKMKQMGIEPYYAGLDQCPDVRSAVDAFVAGRLLPFDMGQLCTGSGNCHH